MWLCNLHLDSERDGARPSTASMRGKKLPSVVFWNWIECIYVVFRKSVLFHEVMANMLLDLYINLLATKDSMTHDLNMIRFDMHIFIQLSWWFSHLARLHAFCKEICVFVTIAPGFECEVGFYARGSQVLWHTMQSKRPKNWRSEKKWKTSHEKSNLYRCFLLQSHLIVGLYCIVLQFSIKIHIDQSWNDIPIMLIAFDWKIQHNTTILLLAGPAFKKKT